MIPSSELETMVEGGKKAVRDAFAELPFRATPEWSDLHLAVEAIFRYVFGGPQPAPPEPVSASTEPPPAPEAPTPVAIATAPPDDPTQSPPPAA